MVKLMFVIRPRQGMTADDARRHWREVHAPIAAGLPGLRRYVQNHVTAGLDGAASPLLGVVELWFDDLDAGEAALRSQHWVAASEDAANFIDQEQVCAAWTEEHIIDVRSVT